MGFVAECHVEEKAKAEKISCFISRYLSKALCGDRKKQDCIIVPPMSSKRNHCYFAKVEVVWASDQDAHWIPPFGCVQGTSSWEKSPWVDEEHISFGRDFPGEERKT